MERSKRPAGVHKGRNFDSGSQWDSVRLLPAEQVMELSDTIEDSEGYVSVKPITEPKSRRLTQSRSVGRESRDAED